MTQKKVKWKGQLHQFTTYFLLFYFGEYLYLNGIKQPSNFLILEYFFASRWKPSPDDITGHDIFYYFLLSKKAENQLNHALTTEGDYKNWKCIQF